MLKTLLFVLLFQFVFSLQGMCSELTTMTSTQLLNELQNELILAKKSNQIVLNNLMLQKKELAEAKTSLEIVKKNSQESIIALTDANALLVSYNKEMIAKERRHKFQKRIWVVIAIEEFLRNLIKRE